MLRAALCALSLLLAAGPAAAGGMGYPDEESGWRGRRHGGHGRHERFHEETVTVVTYREPYLPRGVLYNAPPLPLGYGRGHRGHDVISAKY